MDQVKVENVGRVFRKTRGDLTTAVVFLILALLVKCSFLYLNTNKSMVHPSLVAPELEIPITEGNGAEKKIGSILQEVVPVGQEYFTDIIFLGDSITDGLRVYDIFGDVIQISAMGISPITATTHTFYQVNGEGPKLTMVQAVEQLKPRKLYIMLGTNSLDGGTVEWNLAGYSNFLDELAAKVPDTIIVIQSIPPTLPKVAERRLDFSRENIAKYNQGLLDLALNRGLFYLDVNAALRDSEGFLREDIAANDGIHLTPGGYQVWYDYIVSHAIKGDSAFAIDQQGKITIVNPDALVPSEDHLEVSEEPILPEQPEELPLQEEDNTAPARYPKQIYMNNQIGSYFFDKKC